MDFIHKCVWESVRACVFPLHLVSCSILLLQCLTPSHRGLSSWHWRGNIHQADVQVELSEKYHQSIKAVVERALQLCVKVTLSPRGVTALSQWNLMVRLAVLPRPWTLPLAEEWCGHQFNYRALSLPALCLLHCSYTCFTVWVFVLVCMRMCVCVPAYMRTCVGVCTPECVCAFPSQFFSKLNSGTSCRRMPPLCEKHCGKKSHGRVEKMAETCPDSQLSTLTTQNKIDHIVIIMAIDTGTECQRLDHFLKWL